MQRNLVSYRDRSLGQLLFLIYVNNLKIQNGELIQYTEEVTFCFKSKTKAELQIESFTSLNPSFDFSEIFRNVNGTKSTFANFWLHKKNEEFRLTTMLYDALLEEADYTTFLGMHLD